MEVPLLVNLTAWTLMSQEWVLIFSIKKIKQKCQRNTICIENLEIANWGRSSSIESHYLVSSQTLPLLITSDAYKKSSENSKATSFVSKNNKKPEKKVLKFFHYQKIEKFLGAICFIWELKFDLLKLLK